MSGVDSITSHKSGKKLTQVATKKSTVLSDTKAKEVHAKQPKYATVIFIGGAGDKELYYIDGPHHIVERDVKTNVFDAKFLNSSPYKHYINEPYFGYNEVFTVPQIQSNVIPTIRTKENFIAIIGHSLGGMNAIHLARQLKSMGYTVNTLITLDPVGKGNLVKAFSQIPQFSDSPKGAKEWINIKASLPRSEMDKSDVVAWFGEQYSRSTGRDAPNISATRLHAITMSQRKCLPSQFEVVNRHSPCWSWS